MSTISTATLQEVYAELPRREAKKSGLQVSEGQLQAFSVSYLQRVVPRQMVFALDTPDGSSQEAGKIYICIAAFIGSIQREPLQSNFNADNIDSSLRVLGGTDFDTDIDQESITPQPPKPKSQSCFARLFGFDDKKKYLDFRVTFLMHSHLLTFRRV